MLPIALNANHADDALADDDRRPQVGLCGLAPRVTLLIPWERTVLDLLLIGAEQQRLPRPNDAHVNPLPRGNGAAVVPVTAIVRVRIVDHACRGVVQQDIHHFGTEDILRLLTFQANDRARVELPGEGCARKRLMTSSSEVRCCVSASKRFVSSQQVRILQRHADARRPAW